ncbi:MAG: CBS domain-containing protein [Gaiellaceae bacterium]
MAREPLSVGADATIQEAAAGMRDAGVGVLPVVTDSGELAGIVTDRDIAVRAVAEGLGSETLVGRVLTRRLAVVEPSDELEDALSLMREHQVRRLPVVEGDRLVGMLAQADIAALSAEHEAAETLRSVSEPAATQAERRLKGER